MNQGTDLPVMLFVKNALSILLVAVELKCLREVEILRVIRGMGSGAEPVEPLAVVKIFISAIQFATSSPPSSVNDLKVSAQQQVEYVLNEDDDAPLLVAVDEIRMEAKQCVNRLLARFGNLVESLVSESIAEAGKIESLEVYLNDLSWASEIVTKLETSSDFVLAWVDTSVNIVKVACPENSSPGMQVKVLEVTAKVLEAIGYGSVILPTKKRVEMVKVWLPFVRVVKCSVDSGDNDPVLKPDGELWQSLESALVTMILTLPSAEQAEILREWLENKHIRYPDLTEAFEVWCYRSKVAKRRLMTASTATAAATTMTCNRV
ncbi:BTB/POZ domain-containing protein [Perilla frutescens var. hirtella]|uniref:BTB/POZ domain-containing protein n=1 Tax=Perilla frutescens var. hirtella TaxID=608512 RepID=A0AAD4PAL4_PERFH|nr:BTB/POZ domain-containing protein [Perilla frutescens var. hirtella]